MVHDSAVLALGFGDDVSNEKIICSGDEEGNLNVWDLGD